MRKALLLAALLPTMMMATEANDTTLTINNQQIEINTNGGETTVKVFNSNGKELQKASETHYIDGQEVERVYVTSPFIPQSISRNKRQLSSHYPTFFIGFSPLGSSAFGTGGNAAMHTRDSKSWEWGITLTSIAFRLTNNFAFTTSASIGQVHHHFQDNYILTTHNGITSMRQEEGETLKKSYISYNVVRIPLMIEWQQRMRGDDAFVAVGPSIEFRWNDHSRYFIGKHKNTETGDINLNPFGLNLEARAGYGFIMLYARAGLTPLLKKSSAPECYPLSIGLGFRL